MRLSARWSRCCRVRAVAPVGSRRLHPGDAVAFRWTRADCHVPALLGPARDPVQPGWSPELTRLHGASNHDPFTRLQTTRSWKILGTLHVSLRFRTYRCGLVLKQIEDRVAHARTPRALFDAQTGALHPLRGPAVWHTRPASTRRAASIAGRIGRGSIRMFVNVGLGETDASGLIRCVPGHRLCSVSDDDQGQPLLGWSSRARRFHRCRARRTRPGHHHPRSPRGTARCARPPGVHTSTGLDQVRPWSVDIATRAELVVPYVVPVGFTPSSRPR